jgi:hypothetical protein
MHQIPDATWGEGGNVEDGSEKAFQGITEPEQVGWSRAQLSSKRAEFGIAGAKHIFWEAQLYNIHSTLYKILSTSRYKICLPYFSPLHYVMNVLNMLVVSKTFMKCTVRGRVTLPSRGPTWQLNVRRDDHDPFMEPRATSSSLGILRTRESVCALATLKQKIAPELQNVSLMTTLQASRSVFRHGCTNTRSPEFGLTWRCTRWVNFSHIPETRKEINGSSARYGGNLR